MVSRDHPKSARLCTLLPLGLILCACFPGAAAGAVMSINRRSPTPAMNLTALSDGSLGNIPAQMLLFQAVLSEMNGTAAVPSPTLDGNKQEVDDDKKEAENKKSQDKNNGAVVGSVIGGALAAGLADTDSPAKALCKALAVGAGSAMGAKTGQLIGSAYPPPEDDKQENNTATDTFSSSTTAAEPSQSSEPNEFGTGMVGPGLGNFVGTGVSAGLGKGICDGLFGDAGKWFSKIAKQFLPPDMYDAGKIAMKEALANGRTQILTRAMENAGVPVHQASQFVNELERDLQRVQDFGLDGVAEELQRDLLNGASQIADVIAAGQGTVIAPALGAMGQLGTVTGLVFSTAPLASTPIQQFSGLTGQLFHLNTMASSFSPGNQVFQKAQPIVEELQNAASQAVQDGSSALKNVGKELKNALDLFVPHHDEEKVHHVTKTHVVTETSHVMKTYHKTNHITDTEHANAPQSHHVTKTDHVTKIDYVTKTQYVKETQTITRTKEEKYKVTSTVTKTKTKEEKVTSTTTKTKEVKGTTAPVPGIMDPSLFRLGTNAVCHLNNDRHLRCFGQGKHLVDYDEVSDSKFKKCVKKNDANCFDKKMGGPVQYFADRDDKIRGVACAVKGAGAMCWGTPNHGAVTYKKLDGKKFNQCLYNVKKCD
jgi:hypothetical protein